MVGEIDHKLEKLVDKQIEKSVRSSFIRECEMVYPLETFALILGC